MTQPMTDEATFAEHTERHRRELQLHCYRMLGSLDESEDLVQETFLRAWRRRETYAGRASFRAWLYRIATNACLDALERRPRRPQAAEVPWLQPYPDALLEGIPASDDGPDAMVVAKETVELAFLVAIQHLPPRPRAVLILRDVLGWPARDTADLLETSVASVNSALQRARAGLREHLPERRVDWAVESDQAQRDLLQRYMDATESGDMEALKATLSDDVRFTMPPEPGRWDGRDHVVGMWVSGGFGTPEFGHLRCLLTWANRQPAVANYLRKPGEDEYRPMALDVLRVEGGRIVDVVTFDGALFAAFGLPATAG
jgi:RNA polymerase sigma-70 factor (TIGR02960 family)